MIRRQVESEWFLITQDDHARLSGELAAHVGNQLFDQPKSVESFIRAVAMHDSGWPLHDDEPTLNGAGEPMDVFETTPEIGLRVWAASAERAVAADEGAGLLVSLHSLALSVQATSGATIGSAHKQRSFDMANPTHRFEVNKFQHRQVELQEDLRKRLGLAADLPLRQGLAIESELPAEQEIVFQFRLLQALDSLSLAICCTKPPVGQIRPVLARRGGRALSLRVRRDDEVVLVSPWPFDVEEIGVEVPYRRMEARRFASVEAFRVAYNGAKVEKMSVVVAARR
jgi:hypothetical protein